MVHIKRMNTYLSICKSFQWLILLLFPFITIQTHGQSSLQFTSMCWLDTIQNPASQHLIRVVNSSDTPISFTWEKYGSGILSDSIVSPASSTTYFRTYGNVSVVIRWKETNIEIFGTELTTQHQRTVAFGNNFCENQIYSYWSSIPVGSIQDKAMNIIASDSLGTTYSDQILIKGSGLGINGNQDAFHFAYKPVDCNGSISAQLDTITTEDLDSKANVGLMIRQDTQEDDPFVAVLKSNTDSLSLVYRLAKGEQVESNTISSPQIPIHLKLNRTGNKIEAFYSIDSINWTSLGAIIINLPEEVLFGLAISSGSFDKSTTASFSDVILQCNSSNCIGPVELPIAQVSVHTASLSWQSENEEVLYEYYYQISEDTTWYNDTTSSNSINLENLLPNTTYNWKVRSICISGDTSEFSNEKAFTTLTPPCEKPNRLLPFSYSHDSVELRWQAIEEALSYKLQYRIAGDSSWNILTTTDSTLLLTNLLADTVYEYQIQSACDTAFFSQWSELDEFATEEIPLPPCEPPLEMDYLSLSHDSVEIFWQAIEEALSYKLQYRIAGDSSWNILTTTDSTLLLTNLLADTVYEYQIQSACDTAFFSQWNELDEFATEEIPLPPCNTPGGISTTSIQIYRAEVKWNSVVGREKYVLRYRIVNDTLWNYDTTLRTSLPIENLRAETMYEWQVRTVCANDQFSAYSESVTFTTLENPFIICSAPTELFVSEINEEDAILFWDEMDDVEQYIIRYRHQDSTTWVYDSTEEQFLPLIELQNNTTYLWQVQSVCSEDNTSSFSDSMEFTTLKTCKIPGGLNNKDIEDTSARISWNTSSNTLEYVYRYREISALNWQEDTTILSSIRLQGLNPQTTYEWQVKSLCDLDRESEFSSSKEFTTTFTIVTSPLINPDPTDPPSEATQPIAHWPFDETTGMIAQDIIAGNNCLLNGFIPMGWNPGGAVNGALSFDGIDDLNLIQNLVYAQNNIQEVSLALWVKTTDGTNQGLISFDRNHYYSVEINTPGSEIGKISWNLMTNLGPFTLNSTSRVDDDQWHFVVVVFDHGSASIYIDGKLDAESARGTRFGTGSVQLGMIGISPESLIPAFPPVFPPALPNFFQGALDEVRIFAEALTEAEITNIYINEGGIPPTSFVLFDDSEIWLEAECAELGANWEVVDMEDTVGQYVEIKDGFNSLNSPSPNVADRIRFTFELQESGKYNIFFRTLAPNSSSNSFWVRVNQGDWIKYNDIAISDSFIWDQVHNMPEYNLPVSFQMHTGINVIDIAYREDHTLLDKIHITPSTTSPTSVGPTTACDQYFTPSAGSDIWLEAECADLGNRWSAYEMPDGSGQYMKVNPELNLYHHYPRNTGDYLRFIFETDAAGFYHVWLRSLAKDHDANSYWVRMNEGEWIQFNQIIPDPTFQWSRVHNSQSEKVITEFLLQKGINIFDIGVREDDTQLDKILITMSQDEPDTVGPAGPCEYIPPVSSLPLSETNIWLEAECGDLGLAWETNPLENEVGEYVVSIPGVGRYHSPSNRVSERIRYSFDVVEEGIYNVFFRTWATQEANSFWVRANEGDWIKFNNIQENTTFIWDRVHDDENYDTPIAFLFREGVNSLDVAYREQGTKLDRILISLDTIAPTGIGPDIICTQNPLSSTGTEIYLEAECGIVGENWEMHPIPTETGTFVKIKPSADVESHPTSNIADYITFNFDISKTGLYNVFFRTKATDGANSFWVRANDLKWIKYNDIEEDSVFIWDQVHDHRNNNIPVAFYFTQGENILQVAYREDSTELDKILISMERQTPVGTGPIRSCDSTVMLGFEELDELSEPILTGIQMGIYPNPANAHVHVKLSSDQERTARINIIDMFGRIAHKHSITVPEGTSIHPLSTIQLSSGMYFVKYQDEKEEITHRVIISH